MLLSEVSVGQLVGLLMAIASLVIAYFTIKEKGGFGRSGKRLDLLEQKVIILEKGQESSSKLDKLLVEAMLALMTNNQLLKEKVQEKLNQYLIDR